MEPVAQQLQEHNSAGSESSIKRNEAFFEALFEQGVDAYFLTEIEPYVIIDCNAKAVELFEAESKSQLIGVWPVSLRKKPNSPTSIEEAGFDAESESQSLELEYVTFAGNEFWGEKSWKIIELGERKLRLIRILDITARKKAELRMLLFESVSTNARGSVAIGSINPNKPTEISIEYINPAFTPTTGYEEQDVIGKKSPILSGPKTDLLTLVRIFDSITNLQPISEEALFYKKDGTEFWVELEMRPIGLRNGQYSHWVTILRDITEDRTAKQTLATNEERFRQLAEISPDIIFIIQPDGKNIYINKEELFGLPSGAFDNLIDIQSRIHPDDLAKFNADQAANLDGTSPGFRDLEYRVLNSKNEWDWVLSRKGVLEREPDGSPRTLLGISSIITQRKQIEQTLAASERRFRELAENLPDFIYLLDIASGVITYANKKKIIGYELAENQKIEFLIDKIHPEDAPSFKQKLDAILSGEATGFQESEARMLNSEGNYEWIQNRNGVIERGPDGKAIKLLGVKTVITARKQAEQHLLMLENAVGNANDAILLTTGFSLDEPGPSIEYINPAFTAMTGYLPEDVIGKSPRILQGPKTDRNTLNQVRQALKNWEPIKVELLNYKKDGSEFWIELSIKPFGARNGQYTHWMAIQRDVTQSHNAREYLAVSELRFRKLAKNSPDIIYLVDTLDWHITYINQTPVLGYSFEELNNLNFFQNKLHPDDRDAFNRNYAAILKGEANGFEDFEFRLRNSRGKWEWMLTRQGVLERDANGRAQTLLCITTVITNRKNTEQELQRSERLYRTLVDNFPNGAVFLIDRNYNYLVAGGQELESIGINPKWLEGFPVFKFLASDDQSQLNQIYERAFSETPGTAELHHRGQTYRVHTQPMRNEADQIYAGLVMLQNITDLKKIESALRASESRFRNLIQKSADVVALMDKNGTFTYVSPAVTSILGMPPTEIEGQNAFNYIHPDDIAEVRRLFIKSLLTPGDTFLIEYRYRRKDGSWVTLEVQYNNQLAEPSVNAVIINARDITEWKEASGKVKASLREKEVLLKEIYHRVKNNLQVVSSLMDLQAEQVKDPAVKAIFRESQNRIYSMSLVHEQLYQREDLSQIPIDSYIDSLAKHIRSGFGLDSQVSLRLDIVPLLTDLDTAMRLGLLLTELLTNAFKYAFDAGTQGEVYIETVVSEDRLEKLMIGDNGVGMPAMQPTEKPVSLGLRLVQMLSRQLKASVEVGHKDGTHYTFTFQKPK